MAFLIDGSNLGGRLGGARGARDAAGVMRLLMSWARTRREEAVVVFDGPRQPEIAEGYGALRVEWSGAASADDRIVARLEARSGRWVVVTADAGLAARCRALGARVLAPEELAARAERPRRRARTSREAEERSGKPAPHAEERDYWKKVFDSD
ncbi:MAG TPA: NYN domain-containing protein [Thermoanaerobaculia bacterium]|nr:NYN domain-containing protein [Thermoanaerobaculia bacterium]